MSKLGIAVVVVGGLMLIGSVFGDGDSGGSGDSYGAKDACHDWVRDALKSPSTAEFSNDSVVGSGPWTISGDVDSENSFGAKLRTTWRCEIHADNGHYKGTWHIDG